MDDKEKIKEVLKEIDDFYNSGMYGSDSHDNANRMRKILQVIKNILEK